MLEQPLVSIIVPIYNAQDHIARCVESIRRQTYKNIEILLLNDGSQDVSLQVCEMYARDIPMHRIGMPGEIASMAVFMATKAGGRGLSGRHVQVSGGDYRTTPYYV